MHWEIEHRERMRVAEIYSREKSNQRRKQSPIAPSSRQVEVQANDLPSCQVSSLIDDGNEKQTLHIPPKTTICSWESWDTSIIPKTTLRYSRRRANAIQWKTEERDEAEATTKQWAKIEESKDRRITQGREPNHRPPPTSQSNPK